jgi:hypothetical protein
MGYLVQNAVPLSVFESFVDSLKTQRKMSVTKGNAVSLSFLAEEFFLHEVAAECATFDVSEDDFSRRSERVSELERQMSCFSNQPGQIAETIECQEHTLQVVESLSLALETVQASLR